MTNLQTFKNELFEVEAKELDGVITFDAEQVALSLGITTKVSGKEYVRWNRVNDYLPSYLPDVAKGDFISEPMVYKLSFKASNETAEKFQDWLAIEVIPKIRKTGSYNSSLMPKESFEMQLIGSKYAMEILEVDKVSKVKMLEDVHIAHGVGTEHLPKYIEDEELKVSMSQLLKENNVPYSAIKVNTKLLSLGILEEKERPSSNGGTKKFKSLTKLGLLYGGNAINPRNSKETQPLYYPSKFSELIKLL